MQLCLPGAAATAQGAGGYLHDPGRLLGPLAGVCGTSEVVSIRFSRQKVTQKRRLQMGGARVI